ncbi:glycine betaine/proline transport system permease protein [Gemmobacter megaterium]|uniref:Glycine betaine/proline transport system permease protein n=1 Tax=Gemmobacter megaterium TaxID=1086013 RepID=A0A1N7P854_9RHOB|nr:choline ABC transporter permease subunit [Gemmobacter megaterium]GGE19957.1 choline ABC transporter permease subunit [Gemmobacter megaterium]SIT06717.1 glycine betaine/proline transport system permease protein [Gemmobacter megaterium]
MTWTIQTKIPVGQKAKAVFDWMAAHMGGVFDAIAWALGGMIDAILLVLQWPIDRSLLGRGSLRRAVGQALQEPAGYVPLYDPVWHPFVMIALFVWLTWLLQRSLKSCAVVALGFLFIVNQGYWKATTESLSLILTAGIFCMGVGVPIGIAAAHRPRLYRVMQPVLDLMQTLPTFVYLIPAIVFFGLGMVPGLVATVIFVLPAPIRLTHLGISTTPPALSEAATAFGATPFQKLWKVELPWAWPQIMAGLNQTIMLSLSMVVIAALVGANGLGVPVVRALNSVNPALGFESGMVIVVLAILLDRMLRRRGQ